MVRTMRVGVLGLFLVLSASVSAFAASLVIPEEVPFSKDADVTAAVKAECALPAKLSQFVREYASPNFDKVVFSNDPAPKGAKVLDMQIMELDSRGGGAWSGSKHVLVSGSMKENGKVVGTFKARRYTGGGAFGGYKGTCSLLGRCVKTIAQDIARWSAAPTMDARLGDY